VKAYPLAIAAAALAAAIAYPAYAGDAGPREDVVAIRHDAPILLGAQVDGEAIVDSVVIDRDAAIATWHAQGIEHGMVGLRREGGRWWATGFARRITQNSYGSRALWEAVAPVANPPQYCPGTAFFWLGSTLMADGLGVTPRLLSSAIAQSSDLRWEASLEHSPVVPGVECSTYSVDASAPEDDIDPQYVRDADGTTAVVALAVKPGTPHIRTSVAGLGAANAIAPDPGVTSAIYVLFLHRDALKPIDFSTGSKIDVWFPYVLDPWRRYSLNVAFVTPEITDVIGTLHDNTLHFELPAFALSTERAGIAQIDGIVR